MADMAPKSETKSAHVTSSRKDTWSYLLGFFVAASIVGSFTGYHIQSSYRQELASWRARQANIADSKTQMVRSWLKERRGDAEMQASRPSIRGLVTSTRGRVSAERAAPQGSREVTSLLDEVVQAYGYSGTYILDARGRVVCRSSEAQGFGPQLADVGRAVVRSAGYRMDLLGGESGKTLLGFSAPIRASKTSASPAGGQPPLIDGVVILVIDPAQTIFLLLRETVPTRTGETVIMRREGDEAVFLNALRHAPVEGVAARRPASTMDSAARAALEGRETFGEFIDYRGVRILAATRHIPETGWGLVSKVDCEEALEDFRHLAWVEGTASVLLSALIGGLFWAYRRQMVTRVLRKESEKFRALLESAPDAMVIVERGGSIALVNSRVETMFGYERGELLGQPVEVLVPERLRAPHREACTRFFSQPGLKHMGLAIEMSAVRRDGSEFPIEAMLGPIETGEGLLVSTAIRDVTDRKRAEKELQRLNRALKALSECNQTLVRAASEPELLQKVCEVLVGAGEYRLAWVGYAEQDEGKTVQPMAYAGTDEEYVESVKVSWADTERGRGPAGTAVRSGNPLLIRNTFTDPAFAPWQAEAAKRGYASCIGLPLSVNQEPFGVLCVYGAEPDVFDDKEIKLLTELANDLSFGIQALRANADHRRAEEALRRSEASLAEAQRIAHLGTWDWDLASGRAWWSDEMCRIFGVAPDDFGRTFENSLKCIHPDDRESVQSALKEALEGGNSYDMEHRVARPDGVERFVHARGDAILNEAGRPIRMVGIVHDITERKRAEREVQKLNEELERRVSERTAELEAANKELEAFTYSVSHDLRAPLRHIDGFARLLLERHLEGLSDKGKHYLRQVCSAARQMGTLIDDLLSLSRIGRQEVKWQVAGFNSLVSEVLTDLRPQMAGRRIEWKIGELPFVECDPALLKVVFTNLLSNAVKYTRPRDRAVIEVSATIDDEHPVIAVRDNGVGFSMKYADKLFGVFQRLHRQEDFEGTGVGLATVQRIIHKHGGRIWAEAELNQGATFRFTLGTPDVRAGASGEAKGVRE